MKLLIGIRQNEKTGHTVHILAEGKEKELKLLVKETKEQVKLLTKEVTELEEKFNLALKNVDNVADEIETHRTYKLKYKKTSEKYPKASMLIPKHDKLMLIDGMLL